MARPAKAVGEKCDKQLNLRVTLAQHVIAHEKANAAGLTVGELLRTWIDGKSVARTSSRQADPALISELNRIGVNVNQLARAHHRDSAFVQYWHEIGEELKDVLRRVMEEPYGSENHRQG